MFQPMPLLAPGKLPTPSFLRSWSVLWKNDSAKMMEWYSVCLTPAGRGGWGRGHKETWGQRAKNGDSGTGSGEGRLGWHGVSLDGGGGQPVRQPGPTAQARPRRSRSPSTPSQESSISSLNWE